MVKNKFIVLEGIDGAGKTTVSKSLARKIGAKFICTPPPGFSATRRIIDANAKITSRFLFYLSSVVYTSELIEEWIKKNHVICDRYFISTIAYHNALGLKLSFDLNKMHLFKPDATFFLELRDENERQRRLKERKKYTNTDALLEDEKIRNKLITEYQKYPMMRIDTSSLSANEVVEKIRNQINL